LHHGRTGAAAYSAAAAGAAVGHTFSRVKELLWGVTWMLFVVVGVLTALLLLAITLLVHDSG